MLLCTCTVIQRSVDMNGLFAGTLTICYGSRALKAIGLFIRILKRKTVKQTCGSRLGSVWGSRTEAMQKNKISWTHWRQWFRQINVMRPAIAKSVCKFVVSLSQKLLFSSVGNTACQYFCKETFVGCFLICCFLIAYCSLAHTTIGLNLVVQICLKTCW